MKHFSILIIIFFCFINQVKAQSYEAWKQNWDTYLNFELCRPTVYQKGVATIITKSPNSKDWVTQELNKLKAEQSINPHYLILGTMLLSSTDSVYTRSYSVELLEYLLKRWQQKTVSKQDFLFIESFIFELHYNFYKEEMVEYAFKQIFNKDSDRQYCYTQYIITTCKGNDNIKKRVKEYLSQPNVQNTSWLKYNFERIFNNI